MNDCYNAIYGNTDVSLDNKLINDASGQKKEETKIVEEKAVETEKKKIIDIDKLIDDIRKSIE